MIEKVLSLGSYAMGQGTDLNHAIVTGINSIITYGVKPVGSILLSLFALMEVYKMSSRADTFGLSQNSSARIELTTLSLLKIAFVVYFLQNIDRLMWAIYDMGATLMANVNAVSLGGTGTINSAVTEDVIKRMVEDANLGFGDKIFTLAGLLPVSFMIWICSIAIFVIFTGRMIEIYTMVALSPLPLSTLVHDEHRQIGINFIKSFTAVVLQGGVMIIVLKIYTIIIQNVVIDTANFDALAWSCFQYSLLLIISLVTSGQMAKRITNAN